MPNRISRPEFSTAHDLGVHTHVDVAELRPERSGNVQVPFGSRRITVVAAQRTVGEMTRSRVPPTITSDPAQPGSEYAGVPSMMKFARKRNRVYRHLHHLLQSTDARHVDQRDLYVVEFGFRLASVNVCPAAASGLAKRFVELVGQSPIQYLAGRLMHLAKNLFSESTLALADIGGRIGYKSEAGFRRAFRRVVGILPASWRQATHLSETRVPEQKRQTKLRKPPAAARRRAAIPQREALSSSQASLVVFRATERA